MIRPPSTPTRRSTNVSAHGDFNAIVAELSCKWDLQLDTPEPLDCPSSRKSRSNTEAKEVATACVSKLKFLYYKNAYETPLQTFTAAAWELTNSWIYKPSAEVDTLPNGVVGPLSQVQRVQLLRLLKNELEPEVTRVQREQKLKSPAAKSTLHSSPQERHIHLQSTKHPSNPFTYHSSLKPKRTSDGDSESDSVSKKPEKGEDQRVLGKIDDVPVMTRKTPGPSTKRHLLPKSSNNTLLQKFAATKPGVRREGTLSNTDSSSSSSSTISSPEAVSCRGGYLTSANTSYSANMSKVSSEETTPSAAMHTMSDDSFDSQSFSQLDDLSIEDFSSTATLMTNTPVAAEERIKARLQGVFPILPRCLEKAPFGVRYEITRIFLHTKVPLSCLDEQQIPNFSDLQNYETLWQWLKGMPALSGKSFPPKSDINAWEMSRGTFSRGFKRAVMSGALRFSDSNQEPLFTFQLHALNADLSHRLGRRFGNDRFVDIAIPVLEDPKKLPKQVAELMRLAGKSGRDRVIEWLHQGVHEFLGRTWGLFYIKDRSRKKKSAAEDEDADLFTMKKLCFFATSGIDFRKRNKVVPKDEPVDRHSEMTVEAMLNWLLSLQLNGGQSFLKYYSRISLGLSTTYATVTLRPNEIEERPEDLVSEKDKVMNDGCGRMSMTLARNISEYLGLTSIPSAFQGRIGEAKGLWIVDYYNEISKGATDKIVLETYPTQRKWKRKTLFVLDDEDQRTFEVIKWSSPLKSAALTLQFLPLLEDRGVKRDAISQLLVNGLTYEMGQMLEAIENPQSFRKWLREHHPTVSERLKTGIVKFQGGKPDSQEETLNMLLDAGFDPKKFGYARELARRAFRSNCDMLKEKLNIRVGLSTYAFIAVDFQGVLAPNEIHLCFSNTFRDEISGKSMLELDNMDVLIARSPAHFVSDIQKVRAVFKPQLMGYKDVVMLPSTGDYPLAGLLSGGDYDGDTVWLCFDQEIVQNFQNGDVPYELNLLANLSGDGPFLRKNSTTFSEITAGRTASFTHFLQKSFDFNFRMSFLGICTNYKEQLCYDQKNVSSRNAEYLSTLLSHLVDQNKQGYEFDEEDWARFRSYLSKTKTTKTKTIGSRDDVHVKDYLKRVAEDTTEEALRKYHEALPPAKYFDNDLVRCANDFRTKVKSSPVHRVLLDQLERDIDELKKRWSAEFNRGNRSQDESKVEKVAFRRALMTSFDSWQDIQPVGEEWLKDSLMQASWTHRDHSHWALLKASVLYSSYDKGNTRAKGWSMSPLPWYMACRQLCQLKAMATGNFNAVVPGMFAMLRPDNAFVRMIQSEALDPKFREAKRDIELLNDEVEESDEDYDFA